VRSQNFEKRLLLSECLSLCPFIRLTVCLSPPHGTTWLPPDGCSRNLIFEYFSKICLENSSCIKIWQDQRVLYVKISVHLWQYLAKSFLKWEMLLTKVVDKIKTCISWSIKFFRKSCPLLDNVVMCIRIGYATDDNTAHAQCILDNWGYSTHSEYILLIVFCKIQMVTPTLLSVKLIRMLSVLVCITLFSWNLHFIALSFNSSHFKFRR
jgi:hypothetical protein